MKRILIFSLSYFPKHVGGAEVAIKEITDRIASEDIEFDMITLRFDSTLPKFERIGNVNVHRIGFSKSSPTFEELLHFPMYLVKVLYPPVAALKAFALHRNRKYDGAWAMMSYMGFPIILLRFFLFTRIPYALTLQEGDTEAHVFKRFRIRIVGFLYAPVYRNAIVIQAISNYLAGWAKHMGATCPVIVIPNAVNIKHFAEEHTEDELEAIRATLGKKKGETWLVTTSRLVHKNAVDDVISSLKHLPETVHFLVFGIGPDEEKLKKLAQEEGVYERVHFYGQIGHKDMPKYLKACDIFIRPSRSEGMGNSFVEAMAAELPVIATQEGGIADFLFDRVLNPEKETTGWAVTKDSPKEIADAVLDILRDPRETAKVVATAKTLAFEKYDWNLIAKDMRAQAFSVYFE